jgi:large subunit ribosomal protein LP0
MASRKQKKDKFCRKLISLLQEYDKLFMVRVDMVGSRQMQKIRLELRGKGDMLLGKNTLIRKCIRQNISLFPKLQGLIPQITGNSGFVFIKDNYNDVRTVLTNNFVGAAARSGVVAPIHVHVPAGVTSLQPTETSFFQALNISTKVTKGSLEILADVHLIQKGTRVKPGAAALLQKLGIRPFTYGLEIICLYDDGVCFEPAVLEISDDSIVAGFLAGVSQVAAISLAVEYPTLASIPHSIINAYKNVLSVSVASDYTFPLAKKVKDFLANPEAMAAALAAAAAPVATSAAPAKTAAPAKAAAAKPEPEPEKEEEETAAFDLFD